jgi:hypothetical protein
VSGSFLPDGSQMFLCAKRGMNLLSPPNYQGVFTLAK